MLFLFLSVIVRPISLNPISLYNMVYKLGSKVLANRIRGCFSEVISACQIAFIHRRQIADNSLIAYEINHSLKLKSSGQEGP